MVIWKILEKIPLLPNCPDPLDPLIYTGLANAHGSTPEKKYVFWFTFPKMGPLSIFRRFAMEKKWTGFFDPMESLSPGPKIFSKDCFLEVFFLKKLTFFFWFKKCSQKWKLSIWWSHYHQARTFLKTVFFFSGSKKSSHFFKSPYMDNLSPLHTWTTYYQSCTFFSKTVFFWSFFSFELRAWWFWLHHMEFLSPVAKIFANFELGDNLSIIWTIYKGARRLASKKRVKKTVFGKNLRARWCWLHHMDKLSGTPKFLEAPFKKCSENEKLSMYGVFITKPEHLKSSNSNCA